MKFIISLLIVFFFISCGDKDCVGSIIIDHVGESNKPIPTIIITTDENFICTGYTKCFLVPNEVFGEMEKWLMGNEFKCDTANRPIIQLTNKCDSLSKVCFLNTSVSLKFTLGKMVAISGKYSLFELETELNKMIGSSW